MRKLRKNDDSTEMQFGAVGLIIGAAIGWFVRDSQRPSTKQPPQQGGPPQQAPQGGPQHAPTGYAWMPRTQMPVHSGVQAQEYATTHHVMSPTGGGFMPRYSAPPPSSHGLSHQAMTTYGGHAAAGGHGGFTHNALGQVQAPHLSKSTGYSY